MTTTPAQVTDRLVEEFAGSWRGDTPVFGCCRRSVAVAVNGVEVLDVAALGVTERVQALREAVHRDIDGHLETHRCCAGHVADLAFDLPDLVAPVTGD
jgi:hypothetical protein